MQLSQDIGHRKGQRGERRQSPVDGTEHASIGAIYAHVDVDRIADVRKKQGIEVVEVQAAVDTLVLDEAVRIPPARKIPSRGQCAAGETDAPPSQGRCRGHRTSTASPPKSNSRTRWFAALRTDPP